MRIPTLVALAALAISSQASAAVITGYVYQNQTVLVGNATIANRPLTPADATFTFNGTANFSTGNSSVTTIDQFLASGGVGPIGGAVGGSILNDTYFFFEGTIVLNPGANTFTITHDDGFELDILGLGIGPEVSAPLPTAPVPSTFTITNPNAVATQYNFQMSYGECCGGPAVISVFGGSLQLVPTPPTLPLVATALGGLLWSRRRRAI